MDVNLDAYDIFPDGGATNSSDEFAEDMVGIMDLVGILVVDRDRILDSHNIISACGDINIL